MVACSCIWFKCHCLWCFIIRPRLEGIAPSKGPNASNAFTINGLPSDLYNCSQNQTFKVNVKQGKTYLLRMVNAALNNNFFFRLTNHKFIVVAVHATYTEPYSTDVIVLATGQSADVIFTANQPMSSYYMAAKPYSVGVPSIDNTTTCGIVVCGNATSQPVMPTLLPFFPSGFVKITVPTSLWPESDCTQWLQSKPHGSALYASFGSYAHITKRDTNEIAHGLLFSKVSFIWVFRPDVVNSVDANLLSVLFRETIGDRGIIIHWCS